MAKAAPAFQFYAEKFLAGTSAMSAAARGCYISMLASSWSIGPIVDTPRSIAAAMCLTPFDPPFADLWAEIQPKWVLGPHGWTNAKLEAVRAEQQSYRDRQAEKGRKSAAHRANTTGAQPESNHGLTTVQPALQPEGQPDTQPEPSPVDFDLQPLNLELCTPPLPVDLEQGRVALAFAQFWNAYPRKVSKPDALKAFKALAPSDALAAQIVATVERLASSYEWRTEPKFIPYPATWLRDRRWEDEEPEPMTPSESMVTVLLRECLLPDGASVWFAGAEFYPQTSTLIVQSYALPRMEDYRFALEKTCGRPLTIISKQAVSA